jgi:hypothetical protein
VVLGPVRSRETSPCCHVVKRPALDRGRLLAPLQPRVLHPSRGLGPWTRAHRARTCSPDCHAAPRLTEQHVRDHRHHRRSLRVQSRSLARHALHRRDNMHVPAASSFASPTIRVCHPLKAGREIIWRSRSHHAACAGSFRVSTFARAKSKRVSLPPRLSGWELKRPVDFV